MLISLLKLVILFIFLTNTQQILKLSDLQRCTLSQIQKDPLIQVIQTSTIAIQQHKKQFLMIRVIQKEQRLAGLKMVQLQEKAKNILRKHGLLNHQDLLVMTNLRPQFLLNMRKWQYSMIFAVVGDGQSFYTCCRELQALGAVKIKSIPSINFLNQKIRSIDAFNKAKAALIKTLQRYPKFQIKQIEKIDIFGIKMKNQAIIEHQIKNQGIGTDLTLLQSEFAKIEQLQISHSSSINIGLRAIFRIGNPYIEPQQDSEEQSEYSTQIYSEYSHY